MPDTPTKPPHPIGSLAWLQEFALRHDLNRVRSSAPAPAPTSARTPTEEIAALHSDLSEAASTILSLNETLEGQALEIDRLRRLTHVLGDRVVALRVELDRAKGGG